MRIVVVEDDAALGVFLQKSLALDGHTVDWVSDGEAALHFVESFEPDLMVLDITLPRRDGYDVLSELQLRESTTAVITLMPHASVEDRVRCLRGGADDCLVKPFSFQELLARCAALLRRRARSAGSVLRHGELTVNRVERTVSRNGVEIALTTKEFTLLEHLVQGRGRCCTRADLLQNVFGMPSDAVTNVVDVYINYLRRKLGPDGAKLIETVRGSGYRMRAARTLPFTAIPHAELVVAHA